MTYRKKSALFWALSVLLTLFLMLYQRKTGPTYPVSGKIQISQQEITFKLLRTSDASGDEQVRITVNDQKTTGTYLFKRYKSFDDWDTLQMQREGNQLIINIPHQPPAGKIMYLASLHKGNESVQLTEKPVILRFKGKVPVWIIISHIILIFAAFLLSIRTGFEALINGKHVFRLTIITTLTLFVGGMIFGPLMQKYAFGVYWSGFPLGHDLTDNKTAFALIFWLIALIVQWFNRGRYKWALVASILMFIMYLIPHSLLGSEIDYTQNTQKEQMHQPS